MIRIFREQPENLPSLVEGFIFGKLNILYERSHREAYNMELRDGIHFVRRSNKFS
jgi:hypothetical protein